VTIRLETDTTTQTVNLLLARLERVCKGIAAIRVDVDEEVRVPTKEIAVRKQYVATYLAQAMANVEAAHMTLKKVPRL
jgi:hypothetical protein